MLVELAKALEESIQQTLEDKIGIAFSGGLDSTIIAHVAKKYSAPELFIAGIERCDDFQYAEVLAEKMKLPLHKRTLSSQEILEYYKTAYSVFPGEFLKVELLVPLCAVGEMAHKEGIDVLLFGSGAEELFVGYERYYTYAKEGGNLEKLLKEEYSTLKNREIKMIKKVMRKYNIEARFPFYNSTLAEMAFSIPLQQKMEDKNLKKCVLREAAKFLGVPELAIKRKKKALQYGSGIHNILLKNADYIAKHFPPEQME
ncbi:MAG: asparagine synthase C-terminal domain-containing protein [Candidatus Micrarchaeota archaeon]